jgi:hypothetical protein
VHPSSLPSLTCVRQALARSAASPWPPVAMQLRQRSPASESARSTRRTWPASSAVAGSNRGSSSSSRGSSSGQQQQQQQLQSGSSSCCAPVKHNPTAAATADGVQCSTVYMHILLHNPPNPAALVQLPAAVLSARRHAPSLRPFAHPPHSPTVGVRMIMLGLPGCDTRPPAAASACFSCCSRGRR